MKRRRRRRPQHGEEDTGIHLQTSCYENKSSTQTNPQQNRSRLVQNGFIFTLLFSVTTMPSQRTIFCHSFPIPMPTRIRSFCESNIVKTSARSSHVRRCKVRRKHVEASTSTILNMGSIMSSMDMFHLLDDSLSISSSLVSHTSSLSIAIDDSTALTSPSSSYNLLPDLGVIIPDILDKLPFSEASKTLFNELDIGSALGVDSKSNANNIVQFDQEEATGMVLQSIGQDILIFLSASVIVAPISRALSISPILGYLILGALLGPHGLDVFANNKVDVELGDFGILFLLFSEGLEVSTTRLRKLAGYLPLGIAQISLCAGMLSVGILLVAPALERFLPLLDTEGLLDISSPIEALVLALAGTLSTSAFVFPVLKEREWEEEQSGQAATSILLLQDLAVAPLLVLMPFVVGQGPTDYTAIGFLTAKATIGFGLVIWIGSFVLRQLFDWIAQTRSSETFVALCLLVSVGIGEIAKGLGLTDTAGAFVAGVLLANTNYRAQIQADILPFKGILLGIFFMGAGSSFDTDTVLTEFPTVITGALGLIFFKAVTIFLATRVPEWMERNRLPVGDGIRLALLLSGGGEFAFVILALAEKLDLLPQELGSLLTAIVLITMAITPFLGELAEIASKPFIGSREGHTAILENTKPSAGASQVAEDAIVVCGYGEIGQFCLRVLYEEYRDIKELVTINSESNTNMVVMPDLPRLVAFDNDLSLIGNALTLSEDAIVLYGDASNPLVIQASGIVSPSAVFVAYEDDGKVLSAVTRLRSSFPNTPLYTRSQTRGEANTLKELGATEVVIESDELPRSATAFVWSNQLEWWSGPLASVFTKMLHKDGNDSKNDATNGIQKERLKRAASIAAGIPLDVIENLVQVYQCLDQDMSGQVSVDEIVNWISKSTGAGGIHTDDEVEEMVAWILDNVEAETSLDIVGFCRFYAKSTPLVKQALLIDVSLI